MPGPEPNEVLGRLLAAHEPYYDVQRNYEFAGRTFAGYAEFHSHGEQYVLVKRAKLWEVDAFEYIFFVLADRLSPDALADLIDFMKTQAIAKVHPDPDHMTSYLSLVVVAREADDAAREEARKARFRKNFKLGLRGWADLRVAVVDLGRMDVVTNGQGKQMRAALQANLDAAAAAAKDSETH